MRRITSLMLAAFACAALVTAARADSLLFDYVGFDYENPNPSPGEFGEAGSGYVGLGTVPFLFSPLTSDTNLNEYTFVIDGLTSTGFTPVGNYRIITYNAGTIRIFRDPKAGGTTANFGTNPPNATAPASFTDGENILVGTLTNFQFVLDTTNGTGSFEAIFNATGGTQLGNFPLNERTGWTFSGSSGNALNIPAGYAHQIDGQTFLNGPVATRRTSWGKLKAAFR
jgi:hypothetical protein